MLSCAPVLSGAESPWDPAVSTLIDREINTALATRKTTPSELASDTELLRRVSLDLIGRIPTAAETAAFLADNSPHKRDKLIDTYLTHEELPAYWRLVLHQWLNNSLPEQGAGEAEFLEYLQQALTTNRPWDVITREILLPDNTDPNSKHAAYFLAVRLNGDKETRIDNLTTGVSSFFFGVQLQCAKCHDHPQIESWKQDHYYGLAAFFGRLEPFKGKTTSGVKERADGELTFVTTKKEEKRAKLLFLDDKVFDEPAPPDDKNAWYTKGADDRPDMPFFSRRQVLVDHAIRSDSPFFKRAIVNRLWFQLMGRGLVEPVDQMHEANPATHPQLLTALADDFAASGFNLRRLIAGIVHSQAYQRSSQWTGNGERPAETTYATGVLKPLSPQQLATSVAVASGQYQLFLQKLEREKQNRKLTEITPAIARAQFQRDREVQDFSLRFANSGERFETNAGQALFLAYNGLFVKQLEAVGGNLTERLTKHKAPAAAVQEAYLTILSRPPTADEETAGVEFLSAEEPTAKVLCRDFVWSLLCSSEFRLNH